MKEYTNWIENYSGDIFRKCVEVTNEMVTVFPELRIAEGMVLLLDNAQWYPHQWCVTPDGYIVDPTAKQWVKILEYNEITDGNIPIGKCMECGDIIYKKMREYDPCCSGKCLDNFEKQF